jgi:hypothetical protein
MATDSMHDFRAPRPWVQVAAFCQNAIIEANTGSVSVIKITDSVGVAGMATEMIPQPLQLTMVIILKSDEMRGQYHVKIRCTSPLGQVTFGQEILFVFEGGARGVQTVVPTALIATEPGVYWFDVMIEEDVLTRVPLTVLYQRIQQPPGLPGFHQPGQ